MLEKRRFAKAASVEVHTKNVFPALIMQLFCFRFRFAFDGFCFFQVYDTLHFESEISYKTWQQAL